MNYRAHLGLVSSLLTLVACSESPSDLRRLLGDGSPTVPSIGKTETIGLVLSNITDKFTSNLDIVLTPNGKLTVRRYEVNWQGADLPAIVKEKGEQKLSLTADAANQLRERLALYRPPRLGAGLLLWPRDCGGGMHIPPKAVVSFQDDAKQSGLFILQHGCDSADDKRLADTLRAVVKSLPANKLSPGFRW